MQTRRLGRTDLSIAPLVLGGNVFGWTADKKASFAVLDRFAAAGLTAIDTADAYSSWVPGNKGGESETIIGEWMKARGNRTRVVVITKVGSPMGKGKEGLKPAYIAEAAEASLRRLQTDVIDLYLSHWPDMATPYEETLGAYQRLIEQGKIRWCGASNSAPRCSRRRSPSPRPRGCRATRSCSRNIISPTGRALKAASPTFARARRSASSPISASPRGSSRASIAARPTCRRARAGEAVKAYLDARGFRMLDALDAVAARHKAKPAEVALAWIMARPGVTAPIASATSVEQVDSLVRATELKLSAADMDALTAASAA